MIFLKGEYISIYLIMLTFVPTCYSEYSFSGFRSQAVKIGKQETNDQVDTFQKDFRGRKNSERKE